MSDKPFPIEEFNPDLVMRGRLFCDTLEDDPWVVFHGTSSENGTAIEFQGLGYDNNILSKEDLQLIVAVFEAMKWCGNDTSGYAVLASFSASDFADSASSPIFLAESSVRALLYATREFAGGEKIRGVRKALVDLERYITDESIRNTHMAQMQGEYDHLIALEANPDLIELAKPKPVDLDWLAVKLSELQSIQTKAIATLNNFQGGIVFALRLEESDLIEMSYSSSMGIKARMRIPPERIESRVHIPMDFVYSPLGIKGDFERRMMRMQSGAVGRLCHAASTARLN